MNNTASPFSIVNNQVSRANNQNQVQVPVSQPTTTSTTTAFSGRGTTVGGKI